MNNNSTIEKTSSSSPTTSDFSLTTSSQINSLSHVYPHTIQQKLPIQASMNHGCKNCEWKRMNECPKGLKFNEQLAEGICDERKQYLKNLYTGTLDKPNYEQWVESYNNFFVINQNETDKKQLFMAEEEITKIETSLAKAEQAEDIDEIKILQRELNRRYKVYKMRREWWMQTAIVLDKSIKDKINREMPKVLDINIKKTMSVQDMNRIMRGAEAIDVDSEEVD